MGVFPQDTEIDVPELMRLWVVEGFLKPISGKCLEVVAKEYFSELVDRNLILVIEREYSGEMVKCKVHDLLMDVCVREAQKHKFLCVAGKHNFSNPQDLNTQRRIVVHDGATEVILAWLCHHGTLVRSLTIKYSSNFPKSFNSKLLRVLRVWNPFEDVCVLKSTRKIVNCRYISGVYILSPDRSLLSSIFRFIFRLCIPFSCPTLPPPIFSLWNLQTLYICNHNPGFVLATSEIWNMSQLRHVDAERLSFLDPPRSGHGKNRGDDDFVLGNLQTLSRVRNFKFSGDVVKRIQNIKELCVYYVWIEEWSSYCLNNLVELINLESLYIATPYLETPITSLTFPSSLKKLTLRCTELDWRDIGTKIGSLPHLQALYLREESLVGDEWETVEGQFRSLKYLEMYRLYGLKYWMTESWNHFPCLERLVLHGLRNLKEIPSEIGETLKSIEIVNCSDSAVLSAKEILKEQEDLGNQDLQVLVEGKKIKLGELDCS